MIGSRAATAADDVGEAAGDELAEQAGGFVGVLVVFAERVGQAGVGIADDEGLGETGELFEVRPHLARAERTVHADGERPCVANRGVERVERLARQRAAAAVGDGDGDQQRQADVSLLEDVLDREDRGLGVERVEDGLEQQQIDAAVDQPAHVILVGGARLVERHAAERRVVHIGGNRQRAVHRTDRAGDEPRPVRCSPDPLVGGAARDPGAGDAQLVGQRLESVIRLRDRAAGEGVRLDDVGAGLEVLVVDFADHVGTREHQHVAVALEIARVIPEPLAAEVGLGELVALNHRAHRAVEDQHALPEKLE